MSELPLAFAVPARVLVLGLGALGTTLAASLAEEGNEVVAFTTDARVADSIDAHGLRVRGDAGAGTVPLHVARKLDERLGTFDVVLLATSPDAVEQAARDALPFLAEHGVLVSFSAGLSDARVAAIVGTGRYAGGIAAFSAARIEPGLVERTSAGGLVLGRAFASRDAALQTTARLFEGLGPVRVTENLAGARFAELAVVAAVDALVALSGDRLAGLVRQRFVRRLALDVFTEATRVAHALGVALEPLPELVDVGALALTEAELLDANSPTLAAKHALVAAVGARHRRARSASLDAMARGAKASVGYALGDLVGVAEAHGVAVPVARALFDALHALAEAKRKPVASLDTLRALYRETHTPVAPPPPPPAPPAEVLVEVEPAEPPQEPPPPAA